MLAFLDWWNLYAEKKGCHNIDVSVIDGSNAFQNSKDDTITSAEP